MENNMVTVYFYGKKYSVPGDLTIMTAMEYAGYKVEYAVYANADRLMVGYSGNEYWLDCIEGACDVYIKNLSRQYINHNDGEELFLEVTGDFPLVAQDGSIITLKRGSKFRFRVFEPGEKEHINCVVETEISKEEFVAAYKEREKYSLELLTKGCVQNIV